MGKPQSTAFGIRGMKCCGSSFMLRWDFGKVRWSMGEGDGKEILSGLVIFVIFSIILGK